MHKIKGVIFDLDGTLANTLPLCIRAFRSSIEPLISRSVSDEEIIATFGPSEEGTIMALAPHHYDTGVAGYLHHYETLHEMCPGVFAGIRELLISLKSKSIRIAMVTGKGKKSTDISLKYFDIHGFFEIIETGSPGGSRKTEAIQMVLNEWPGLQKEEVIYVGDAPSDIEASRKAGIGIVAAAWAETTDPVTLQKGNPDELFYSISELTDWLFARI